MAQRKKKVEVKVEFEVEKGGQRDCKTIMPCTVTTDCIKSGK